VNHEDAVFAKYYFNAYDNWLADSRSHAAGLLIAFDSLRRAGPPAPVTCCWA
jgi:hypothetical protein